MGMKKLAEKAKESIEKMTPEERGEHLQKMQKKVEIFMKLPDEGKKSYMQKLTEAEKIDFMKCQMLMMSLMQQQQMQQMQQANSQQVGTAPPPGVAAAAPSQQEMM